MEEIMKFLKGLIIFCFLITSSLANSEELTNEKKVAIDDFLEITGALQIGELLSNNFIQVLSESLKQARPDIDPKAFDIIKEEVGAVMSEEIKSLLPSMYSIYHKYLTLEEIKELVQFYKTPVGRKYVSVMPKMTQEGMEAGQLWGQSLGPKIQQRVLDRLQKEGINIE